MIYDRCNDRIEQLTLLAALCGDDAGLKLHELVEKNHIMKQLLCSTQQREMLGNHIRDMENVIGTVIGHQEI